MRESPLDGTVEWGFVTLAQNQMTKSMHKDHTCKILEMVCKKDVMHNGSF